MKYRKKPVVIEAVKLTRNNVTKICDWISETTQCKIADFGVTITTLEGNMQATWGDYIIEGVEGEFYPCKPQIFLETYEKIDVSSNIKF